MTSYQRVSVLALRLVGTVWTLFFTVAWGAYFAEVAFGVDVQHYPAHTIIGNVAYVVLGVLVIGLSKPLGRIVARGLE